MSYAVAYALVGGYPNAATILETGLLKAAPQHEEIDAGTENERGRADGYGPGYTEGSNKAYRVCDWNRGNYPAIPALRSGTALAQNGGICVYCNVAGSTVVDHVYPVQKHWVTLGYLGAALGDVNDANNLVGSCAPCNGAKSNTYLNAWAAKLGQPARGFQPCRRAPFRPSAAGRLRWGTGRSTGGSP